MGWFDDVRFGARGMVKHPGLSAVAIVALALGIGANATVFAIANGALFKRMPFVSEGILYLWTRSPVHAEEHVVVSWPDFRDWSAHAKSFRAWGAYQSNDANLSDKADVPTRYSISSIRTNTFS